MLAFQRELFRSDVEILLDKINTIQISHDKVRRKMMADLAKLKNDFKDLNDRQNLIEKNICRGENV